MVRDQLDRPLGVLRLSLTARCNLACPYCCPDSEDPPDLLSLAERTVLVCAAVGLGVHTLRLTGGEPLLHPHLDELIAGLKPLRPALATIALTSNGVLLTAERAKALREAGLDRLTLSLDGSDGATVAAMAGLRGGAPSGESVLRKVLAAIEHARNAGFDPALGDLKLNAVITRHGNADQLRPLAALARERGVELRLIEFMDVGNRNGWRSEEVVPAAEMVRTIGERWPLEPLGRGHHSTASRWRYVDGGGHLSVVASITAPFCGDCNRLRITADGVAYTCLFGTQGIDLKPWLRPVADPGTLEQHLRAHWRGRRDRYSEERSTVSHRPAEMSYLGG